MSVIKVLPEVCTMGEVGFSHETPLPLRQGHVADVEPLSHLRKVGASEIGSVHLWVKVFSVEPPLHIWRLNLTRSVQSRVHKLLLGGRLVQEVLLILYHLVRIAAGKQAFSILVGSWLSGLSRTALVLLRGHFVILTRINWNRLVKTLIDALILAQIQSRSSWDLVRCQNLVGRVLLGNLLLLMWRIHIVRLRINHSWLSSRVFHPEICGNTIQKNIWIEWFSKIKNQCKIKWSKFKKIKLTMGGPAWSSDLTALRYRGSSLAFPCPPLDQREEQGYEVTPSSILWPASGSAAAPMWDWQFHKSSPLGLRKGPWPPQGRCPWV